jgi:hypothetical protein
MFADLFPSGRGRPSVPADVVATTMVLQALEGLSDRDAVRQLATNIAWKAAAGLALPDEAFHPTVLTLWRNRLRAPDDRERIFNAIRAVITESGVLTGKTRRAIDSTVLDDAVARQDTVSMLVTQIRRVRRLVPGLRGVWVREHNLNGGRPPCDWDDPVDLDRLVSELVDDANELVWAADDLDLDETQADAVALLALVAGQDVEPGDGPGQWRIAQRTAPDRVISTVDPEARHTHKTQHSYRDGYKAHVDGEPDTGLVTGNDHPRQQRRRRSRPRASRRRARGHRGPGRFRLWHRRPAGASARPEDDRHHQTPTPTTRHRWRLHHRRLHHRRDRRDGYLPERDHGHYHRCSSSRFPPQLHQLPGPAPQHYRDGRIINLHPHHDLLTAARAHATTPDFQATYRQHRPMIERTIAWLVRGTNRPLRYRGLDRNKLWWSHRCAAINLQRLVSLGLTHRSAWAIA